MSKRDDWYAPRDLHLAAMYGYRIKTACPRCGRSEIFDGYALWWLFQRKGWSQHMSDLPKRFSCMRCFTLKQVKVRPTVKLVYEEATVNELPRPDPLDWKKSVRRRRT